MKDTPPGWRTARVVASDAKPEDWLSTERGWVRVLTRERHGDVVELKCDEPIDVEQPRAYFASVPVAVQWRMPTLTTEMGEDLQRPDLTTKTPGRGGTETAPRPGRTTNRPSPPVSEGDRR